MLNLFDRFIAENTTNSKSFGVRSGNSSNYVGKLEEEINRKRKAANLEVTIKKIRRIINSHYYKSVQCRWLLSKVILCSAQ